MTDVTDETVRTIHVEFTSISGERQSFTAEAGPDRTAPGASATERTLTIIGKPPPGLRGAKHVSQRRVIAPPRRGVWTAFDALDTEIRIGLHLVRGCERVGLAYPGELSELVGYEADGTEPFALHLPSHGEPCAKYAGRFVTNQEESFKTGLLRALRLLEGLGVVHGSISDRTVLWDAASSTVRIVDFSTACLTGEVPRDVRRSPLLPPVRNGDAPTNRDDVYLGGALLCRIATGNAFTGLDAGIRPDYQDLLRGVFASSPDSRPTAAELLERVLATDPWPGGQTDLKPAGYLEGVTTFDSVLVGKAPRLDPSRPKQIRPQSPRGRRRRLSRRVAMIVGAATVGLLLAAAAGVVLVVAR